MRSVFILFFCLIFGASVMASPYPSGPLLVVSQPEPAAAAAAEKSTTTAAPLAGAPAKAAEPVKPETEKPQGPTWPRDTVPIFLTSCSKLRTELLDPCRCIINRIMNDFTHDEFMKIDAAGGMQTNPTMLQIRQQCVDKTLQERKRPTNPGSE